MLRVQSENFQQPRVCGAPLSVSEPGFRGRLLPHQDVHHQDVLCQGEQKILIKGTFSPDLGFFSHELQFH
jgi:hypothetical protein